MKKVDWHFSVFLTTTFVLVYHMSPFIGFTDELIIAMFITSPLVVFWMGYKILKSSKVPTKKFSDGYFYDDLEE